MTTTQTPSRFIKLVGQTIAEQIRPGVLHAYAWAKTEGILVYVKGTWLPVKPDHVEDIQQALRDLVGPPPWEPSTPAIGVVAEIFDSWSCKRLVLTHTSAICLALGSLVRFSGETYRVVDNTPECLQLEELPDFEVRSVELKPEEEIAYVSVSH